MFTQAKIYNLALQALLLTRQIIDVNSDKSNEAKVLNELWPVLIKSGLADLDLDSTSTEQNLLLVAKDPVHHWRFAYKYPDKCAFFRRIRSHQVVDDKFSHHSKRVMIWEGQKVIFANHENAVGEYIPIDFPLQTLSAPAGMALAHRLAWMAAPLIVGKGASALRNNIDKQYIAWKAEAQAQDERESFSFQSDENMSEFVKTRMS